MLSNSRSFFEKKFVIGVAVIFFFLMISAVTLLCITYSNGVECSSTHPALRRTHSSKNNNKHNNIRLVNDNNNNNNHHQHRSRGSSDPIESLRKAKPHLSDRVLELVASMSIEDKARQLDMYSGAELLDANRDFDPKALGNLGAGVIHDFYPKTADLVNEIQAYVLNSTHSRIPVLFLEECLHGLLQEGHTIFPQAIALGSTWDPSIVHDVARAIASEARAYGIGMCLAPVLGIAREPRWGRTEETYGEDTYLNSRIGVAFISGLQDDGNLASNHSVIAEPKHFAAHSIPEGGRNTAPAHVGYRELETFFLPVFKAAVKEAGAKAIMAAYSEIDGLPNCANEWLLTETLRDEWGFDGFVLSDLGAITMLYDVHRVASSPLDAIKQFLESGGNMQFYDFDHDTFQQGIINMTRDGILSMDIVNARVADLLHVKELLGLFDNPFTPTDLVALSVNSKAHQELALEAVRRSIILLQNNATNNSMPMPVLPLSKNVRSLLCVGMSCSEPRTGDYSGGGDNVNNINLISVLQGIKQLVGPNTQVLHAWGAGILEDTEMLPIHWPYLIPPSSMGNNFGLRGAYYATPDLSGTPVLQRLDVEVNFQWYYYGPEIGVVPPSNFSARWDGYFVPDATVQGLIGVDANGDAVILYIDEQLVIDTRSNASNPTVAQFNFVEGRKYAIVLEYFQSRGSSIALQWNLVGPNGIQMAAEAAKKADVVVMAVGENTRTCGEGLDRTTLDLPGRQHELIKAVYEATKGTSTKLVLVLQNGRPLSTVWEAEHIPAIIEAFYPGQAGGLAIAEVLFGDYNPAGRLSITVPKEVGQIPLFYNYAPSARPNTYVGGIDSSPLFAFGHGLSYTSFNYSQLSIIPQDLTQEQSVQISIVVKNVGERTGDEVVQLYIRDDVASVTTPVQQLKGFTRISLQPGQSQKVSFTIEPQADLVILSRQYKWVVEPGTFTVMVGAASDDIRATGTFTIYK